MSTGRVQGSNVSLSRSLGWSTGRRPLSVTTDATGVLSPEQCAPELSGSANIRLLIVDDHSVVRHGATSWLRAQSGYQVVGEAGTARQGVALAILHKPDIVLLDVGLGDEGGLCAAYQIIRTCSATSVIAYSASADPVHVRGMLTAGARGYVLKTSDPPVLLSAIRAVLAGSRFLDPGLSEAVIEELALFPGASRGGREILTPREWQVLECIVWGYRNREIAAELLIKITSVNTYRIRLCEKLGLTSKAEIVRFGIAAGLTATGTPPKRLPKALSEKDFSLAHRSEAGKKAC